MFFFFFFFEQNAIDIIEQALQGEETLVAGAIDKEYAYDYLLPKGCKQLGFSRKTAIEIKKELAPGYYSIFFSDARKSIEKGICDDFVVIYEKAPENHYGYAIPSDIESRFSFLSYDVLKRRAEKLGIKPKAKDWKDDRDLRIKKLRNEIRFGQNTLFVGAGLSMDKGAPSWNKLLCSLADQFIPSWDESLNYKDIENECDN